MASTWYVNGSVGASGDGSAGAAFKTIGEAMAAAGDGDTVVVAAGTYNENVVISDNITLQGAGHGTTTIVGQGNTALGAIVVTPGSNGVKIDGFHVVGINNASPGIESAAIYLQGAHSNLTITNNNVEAKGDLGLMSEYGHVLNGVTVTDNIFSGTSFDDSIPAGNGNQFTTPNFPRALVFLGTNTDNPGQESTGIIFTGNTITGIAGGLDALGNPVGNTLVTIDATNSLISENDFTGYTVGNGFQLRTREQDVDIYDNSFSGTGNIGMYVQFDGVPGSIHDNDGAPLVIAGTGGNDNLLGTAGDDIFAADAGNDIINGLDGIDTIDMAAAGSAGSLVVLDIGGSGVATSAATGFDTLHSIENVNGSSGIDIISGNSVANVLDGRGGNDTLDGREGDDTLKGGDGNDTLKGGAGNDTIDGGTGIDTAVYDEVYVAPTVSDGGSIGFDGVNFTVNASGFTDTLSNVEKVTFNGQTVWLVANAAGLTDALASAGEGDVIKLAPNTYKGHFTIDKDGLTIESVTGNPEDVVIEGDFRDDNPSMGSADLDEWIGPQTSYNGGTNNNGFVVLSNNVTIRGLTVTEQRNGIQIGSASDTEATGLTIDNVVLDNNVHSIHKENGQVNGDGFSLTNSSITHSYQGVIIAAPASGGQVPGGSFDGITIDNVTFENLTEKGMYFEQLSNATLTRLTMNNVGQFGRSDAFGVIGQAGAGIDINVKFADFSTITIDDFDFTDVGLSNGAGTSHVGGGAITIKARDDGSYSTFPATLDGVIITNGTIDGTSTGIRLGEPGKINNGPTGVTIDDVDITDAAVGSYDNRTNKMMVVTLSEGADTVSTNPAATGPITYEGLGGNDNYTINGTETIVEEVGGGLNDTVTSRGHHTLAANVENLVLLAGATNLNGKGNGSDNTIDGNAGDNCLAGMAGDDVLNGGDGNDKLIGGLGDDIMNGGNGNDTIIVNAGSNDVVDGGAGTDEVKVVGGAGSDTVNATFSGSGITSLGGNIQNVETFSLDLAGGNDTLNYSNSTAGVTVSLQAGHASGFNTIAGIENLVGSSFADSLVGDGGDNVINGGSGSDFINGAGGTDTVAFDGDWSDYTITFSAGSYTITGDSGVTIVTNVEQIKFGAGATVDIADALTTHGPTLDPIANLITIDETDNTGGLVLDANAFDINVDAGLDDEITYSLRVVGTNTLFTGPFSIDSDGKVTITGALDFETLPEYTFDVVATDRHGNRSVETVTVDVLNVDELDLPDVPAGSFESGLTEAVVGDLVNFDHSYEITNLDLLGGQALLNGVAIQVGQTLTMAELNSLVFTSGAVGLAQIQIEATADGGDTDIFTVTLNVTDTVDSFHNGTSGNDRIDGAGGNDYIDGRGGVDTMIGGAGDDIFIIAQAGDRAVENLNGGTDEVRTFINYTLGANVENARALGHAGVALAGNMLDNTLTGNSNRNNLSGRAGDDVLNGMFGNDVLSGNMGSDTFVFSSALHRTSNVDRILDFDRLDDQIHLSSDVFSKAGPDGFLAPAAFKRGASATDANDRIIYDQSNGQLFYDADGNGAGAQVLFAVIANRADLRAADFEII